MTHEKALKAGKLTTDHPASSYGQPVYISRGVAYGPADVVDEQFGEFAPLFAPRTAAEIVAAEITHGHPLVERFLALPMHYDAGR